MASAGVGDLKEVCDAVLKARNAAQDALAPASLTLAKDRPSANDVAKATDDLKAAFTAMHLDVAAAAERAGTPQLKARITDYQVSVEQAIVAVEGADGDKTKLAAAIDLPALRSAEKAVMAECRATSTSDAAFR